MIGLRASRSNILVNFQAFEYEQLPEGSDRLRIVDYFPLIIYNLK